MIKPEATDQELLEVCRAVGIHDTLSALPAGYDTKLGENCRSGPAVSASVWRSRVR